MEKTDFDSAAKGIELLYIWIQEDETGFIREQGFNLSSQYRFRVTSFGENRYNLYCDVNTDYPNMWNTGNIINLTAIVGKNGSGKTSLLRQLISVVPEPTDPIERVMHPHIQTLQAYKQDDSVLIVHNFPEEVFVNKTSFQMIRLPDFSRLPSDSLAASQSRCFLSNTNLGSLFNIGGSQCFKPVVFSPLAGIGINNYTYEFSRKVSGHKMGKDLPQLFLEMQDTIAGHVNEGHFDAIVRLSYYDHLYSGNIPRHHLLPKERKVRFEIVNPINWMNRKNYGNNEWKERYGTSVRQMLDWYYKLNYSMFPQKQVHPVSVLKDALALELIYLTDDVNINERDLTQLREDPRWYLGHRLKNSPNGHEAILSYYRAAWDEINEFGTLLKSCTTERDDLYSHKLSSGDNWWVARDETFRRLCAFIDKLMRNEYSFVLKYLNMDLPPQSSGECALQFIFSRLRLPPCFRDILGTENIEIKDNVLLLLDEIDLYMHPEWQRKFLKMLADELKEEYPDKHIQVIITTHSPLVLSDIPAGNTIYLKNKDGHCAIVPPTGKKDSFGANIFTLLKDSFFLERSIGEFAFSRIEEMINRLNELKNNPADTKLREQCRDYSRIINIIGEPVIRQRLELLYHEACDQLDEQDIEDVGRRLNNHDPAQRKKYREMLQKLLDETKDD